MRKVVDLKGIVFFVLTAAILTGGGIYVSRMLGASKTFHRSEYMMGTIFDITAIGDDERSIEGATNRAFSEIKRIDDLMSRYKEGSEVSLVNKSAGIAPAKVGHELVEVLKEGTRVSELSDGAFDVTIGPLTNLWGFDEDREVIPSPQEIEKLRRLVDYRKLRIDEAASTAFLEEKGMMIDVGGIAKGYAVARAIKVFEDAGIKNVIVNAGGNLGLRGGRWKWLKWGWFWTIGIQHPRDESKLLGKLTLTDIAVATSGDYQRYFIKDGIRYHHILDPKTGYPSKGLISATVIGRSRTSMDGLSSAVFILGAEKGMVLMKKIGAEGVMVTEDGRIIASEGIKGRFQRRDE